MKKESYDLVLDISKALLNLDNPGLMLDDVLESLRKRGLDYAAIKIVDPTTEEIIIRYAAGLTAEERKRGRYKIGEGITGTVVKTGETIIIRHIQDDPRFLNRTGASDEKDGTFYCFPIPVEDHIVGALSAFSRTTLQDAEFLEYGELLKAVVPFVAQSLRIHEKFQRQSQILKEENQTLRSELQTKRQIANFVGSSSKMNQVFDQIRMVSNSMATVLIRGENGTGKELVAETIHYSSGRANKPLIKVNCAAIPENLLESELFGHEKGAFTGAVAMKKGRVELAECGTLFLDEIGEITHSTQVKLLRFLQSREFERVGGTTTLQANVRIIAATNRNLEEEIRKGNFREDLYYRLNVFPIFVPSLRERKSDITLLADYFLEKYANENKKSLKRISTPAIEMLMAYHWPGNVRELENALERAVLLCQTDTIRAQDLPPSLQTSESTNRTYDHWSLPQAVANLEREMIMEALKNNNWHQGKAAQAIGVTERQMGYKMRKYAILKDSFQG
ncbi:MAG TPA: sigma 54-interacting transcriptional regulator [Fibrobacteraceae bacterium]|nr:sigma 54-interacting transcriptional regulator [Fibrobacteraceae bacterium]